MAGLILKLRAHEQILVNGVVMQNGDRNARLIVKTPDAKILRLRDAIHPDAVDTPVKRACYAAQLAVAGEAPVEASARQLRHQLADLRDALGGLESCDTALTEADDALDDRNFYCVLKSLRRLLPVEERLLALAAAAPGPAVSAARV